MLHQKVFVDREMFLIEKLIFLKNFPYCINDIQKVKWIQLGADIESEVLSSKPSDETFTEAAFICFRKLSS